MPSCWEMKCRSFIPLWTVEKNEILLRLVIIFSLHFRSYEKFPTLENEIHQWTIPDEAGIVPEQQWWWEPSSGNWCHNGSFCHREQTGVTRRTFLWGVCHKNVSFKVFVIVIPKEALAGRAVPVLFLVWWWILVCNLLYHMKSDQSDVWWNMTPDQSLSVGLALS